MSFEMSSKWSGVFERAGAVYIRPDLDEAPHIDYLKSGNHGDIYFNSDYAVQDPDLTDRIADEWAENLEAHDLVPDRVIGHAAFAIEPAGALARGLRRRGHRTRLAYSRQSPKVGFETSFPIEPDERIVVVADDVVSGKSSVETARHARSLGGIILPAVPCLANLSGADALVWDENEEPATFIAAATFRPDMYYTQDSKRPCTFCRDLGSRALAPRVGNNWQELQSWMRLGQAGA